MSKSYARFGLAALFLMSAAGLPALGFDPVNKEIVDDQTKTFRQAGFEVQGPLMGTSRSYLSNSYNQCYIMKPTAFDGRIWNGCAETNATTKKSHITSLYLAYTPPSL